MGNIGSNDFNNGYSTVKKAALIYTYVSCGVAMFIVTLIFIGCLYGYIDHMNTYDTENVTILSDPACSEEYEKNKRYFNCKNVDYGLENKTMKTNEYLTRLSKPIVKNEKIKISVSKSGDVLYNDNRDTIFGVIIGISAVVIIFLVGWIILVRRFPDLAVIGMASNLLH